MPRVLCPVPVGRDRELDLLASLLRQVKAAHGAAAVVLGEAGSGKSRLVRELAAGASQHGLTFVVGRAVERSTHVPFRPLREALMAAFRTQGAAEDPELAPFRPALGRLVPEWADAGRPVVEDSVLVVGEGALRLLGRLGGRNGTVLALEDLQWADSETLEVVEYLADNLTDQPLLVVGTVRSEAWSPALDLARRLEARDASTVLELAPLGTEHVASMIEHCLGVTGLPPAVVTALRERTGGLPLLIEDLLASAVGDVPVGEGPAYRPLADSEVSTADGTRATVAGSGAAGLLQERLSTLVPPSFSDSVRRRVDALAPHERAVVHMAAAFGSRFDWTLVGACAAQEAEGVIAALRAARDAQLLVEDGSAPPGEEFRFRHALTRDAVWARLLAHERATLAAAGLDALLAARPDLPEDWLELGVGLAVECGREQRAAELLLEGGRRSLAGGALASAEAALRRARHLGRADPALVADVDEALTQVLALDGKAEEAFAVGRRLLTSLASLDVPAGRRAEVLLLLARAAVEGLRWEDAQVLVEECRPLVEGDEPRTARLSVLAAKAAVMQGRLTEAERLAQAARSVAERESLPEVVCESLEVLGRAARPREGSFEHARELLGQALTYADRHGLRLWRVRVLQELGLLDLLESGAREHLEAARDQAWEAGALATAAWLDALRSVTYIHRWENDEALAVLRRGEELARRFRLERVEALAVAQRAVVLAAAEVPRAEMEAVAEEALAISAGDPAVGTVVWGYARALRSLLEEDRARASAELDRGAELYRASPVWPGGSFLAFWVLVRTLEGDEAAREEVRASPAMATHISAAAVGYADAAVLARSGDVLAAERACAHAERLLAASWWATGIKHLVRRLAAEAALDGGWGSPETWLRETVAFYEHTPHRAVADAARALMRQGGFVVPRRGRGDAEVPEELRGQGVTSREVDVLALLAEQLTNADIAARLHLSPRTVAKHVEHLLAKTGAADRRALAALAREIGMPPGAG